MSLIDYNLQQFIFTILMSFRLGALFMSLPIISDFKMPLVVRVLLPMSMALLLAPIVPHQMAPGLGSHAILFFYAILMEVLVGILMGFSAHILFMLSNIAGEIAGMQVGFSIASVFDPSFGQSSLISFFMQLFLTLMFFFTNMHHVFIWVLAESYQHIPPGSFVFPVEGLVPGLMKLFTVIYMMAFRLTLPVLVTIFLAHVMVGIISITAPQMNFYFNVSISLNVIFGMIVISLGLSLLFQFFYTGTLNLEDFLRGYFLVR